MGPPNRNSVAPSSKSRAHQIRPLGCCASVRAATAQPRVQRRARAGGDSTAPFQGNKPRRHRSHLASNTGRSTRPDPAFLDVSARPRHRLLARPTCTGHAPGWGADRGSGRSARHRAAATRPRHGSRPRMRSPVRRERLSDLSSTLATVYARRRTFCRAVTPAVRPWLLRRSRAGRRPRDPRGGRTRAPRA
jgi:hypothetical protein